MLVGHLHTIQLTRIVKWLQPVVPVSEAVVAGVVLDVVRWQLGFEGARVGRRGRIRQLLAVVNWIAREVGSFDPAQTSIAPVHGGLKLTVHSLIRESLQLICLVAPIYDHLAIG